MDHRRTDLLSMLSLQLDPGLKWKPLNFSLAEKKGQTVGNKPALFSPPYHGFWFLAECQFLAISLMLEESLPIKKKALPCSLASFFFLPPDASGEHLSTHSDSARDKWQSKQIPTLKTAANNSFTTPSHHYVMATSVPNSRPNSQDFRLTPRSTKLTWLGIRHKTKYRLNISHQEKPTFPRKVRSKQKLMGRRH